MLTFPDLRLISIGLQVIQSRVRSGQFDFFKKLGRVEFGFGRVSRIGSNFTTSTFNMVLHLKQKR
jgi:hypothetical protein